MILPLLGGSPAVWNASLAFYQGALLIGYAYAHYLSSWIGIKRHAFLHLALVFAAILLLPVTLPVHWFSAPAVHPTQLVLAALTVAIGFPFFVIAAAAPLLQKWIAQTSSQRRARSLFFIRGEQRRQLGRFTRLSRVDRTQSDAQPTKLLLVLRFYCIDGAYRALSSEFSLFIFPRSRRTRPRCHGVGREPRRRHPR